LFLKVGKTTITKEPTLSVLEEFQKPWSSLSSSKPPTPTLSQVLNLRCQPYLKFPTILILFKLYYFYLFFQKPSFVF